MMYPREADLEQAKKALAIIAAERHNKRGWTLPELLRDYEYRMKKQRERTLNQTEPF